jgi:hypothetical protein
MENAKTILFLSEMPITNGVIQAQLIPLVLFLQKNGYETHIVETIGRFDSQEKYRESIKDKLEKNKVVSQQICIPRFTFLPSILYFTFKSLWIIKKIVREKEKGSLVIYARNYKFTLVLTLANWLWNVPTVYSPRGAYVAERKYYRKIKDSLYGRLVQFFEKKAIGASSATIVESNRFKDHIEKLHNLRDANLTVISNYYDETLIPSSPAVRQKMRQKLGFGNKKIIVYAGTVEVWYNFSKMFDLVSRLKKNNPDFFFQLFIKEDYARDESAGMAQKLEDLAGQFALLKGRDYDISSYPPEERYQYLSACDVGICLTTPQEFKTMMLYLKIVDYLGVRLPIIVNSEVKSAVEIIKSSGSGAIVDYSDWDNSISKINMASLFGPSQEKNNEYQKFSSQNILPKYLELFSSVFNGIS